MQTTKQLTGRTAGGIYYRLTPCIAQGIGKDAPTLALIMGYGGSCRVWPQTFIDKLTQRVNVITYDNRGTGTSFLPASEEEYTIPLMAEDLSEVVHTLADTLSDPAPIHVLGYSMGGCIAIQYALAHAKETRSLFLLSTTGGGRLMHRPDRELSYALANPQGKTMWDVYDWTFRLMYATANYERALPKLKLLYEQARATPTRPQALKGHSHAFKHFDAADNLDKLSMPVTIMTGADDRLMPPQNSRALAEAIKQAKVVEVEDIEHGVHIEQEDLVVAEIFKLVDRS